MTDAQPTPRTPTHIDAIAAGGFAAFQSDFAARYRK